MQGRPAAYVKNQDCIAATGARRSALQARRSDLRSRARRRSLGITSVRHFVRDQDPVTTEDVLDHFDHAVKLVGVEDAGLGSDFDPDPHPSYDIPGLNDSGRLYELIAGLLRRGYTCEHVRMMLGGNFQRALREIWT